MSKLTEKQKFFCKEYLVDKNATQAAIRAGYSESTAKSIGCENLTKPNIQALIQKELHRQSERIEITADGVLKELGKLGHSNIDNYITIQEDGSFFVDLSNLTLEQSAAIQEVTTETYLDKSLKKTVKRVKLKIHDKHSPLNTLAKHYKLLTDKVEHTGSLTLEYGHRKPSKEPTADETAPATV